MIRFSVILFFLFAILTSTSKLPYNFWNKNRLKDGIIMIRTANFIHTKNDIISNSYDCINQNKLSNLGIIQSKNIGDWIKKRGYESNEIEIFSSENCQTLETASIIAKILGVKVNNLNLLTSINSTSNLIVDHSVNELKKFLIENRKKALKNKKQKLLLLFSNYETIKRFSKQRVPSAGGVLLRYQKKFEPKQISIHKSAFLSFNNNLKIDFNNQEKKKK